MSEPSYNQPTGYDQLYDQPTGWTGWITFAAIMMIIGGSLNLLYGIIAAVNDDWVVFTNRADVYLDLSEWGWAHIILGTVVLLSGIFLLSWQHPRPDGRRHRRQHQPVGELLLHSRLPTLGTHGDRPRRPRDLGRHSARSRSAGGVGANHLQTTGASSEWGEAVCWSLSLVCHVDHQMG